MRLHEGIARENEIVLREVKQAVSGGIAGCVSKTCVAPLSRVTILMQVQRMRPDRFQACGVPHNTRLWQNLAKIYHEEGVFAYWRGNGAMLLHRFPNAGVTFWGHRFFAARMCEWRLTRIQRSFVAGAASGGLGVVACYPMDVVKTRLSAQTTNLYYNGISDAFSKIWVDEGLPGFYRGLPVCLCSVVPMIALNFGCFEIFMRLLDGRGLTPWLNSLVAGGLAGGVSSTAVFPVDLLRRQMQMVGLGGRPAAYSNVFDAATYIYNTGHELGESSVKKTGMPRRLAGLCCGLHGCREFFRGLVPELVKVCPNVAIMFCVNAQLMGCIWPCEYVSVSV